MKFSTLNPYTQELIHTYEVMDNQQIETALYLSQSAFFVWKTGSYQQRAQYVTRIAELLLEHKHQLALIITTEMGKILSESIAEIEKCAFLCQYYAKESEQLLQPQDILTQSHLSRLVYQPIGAVLGIMPWNFPFWQVFRFVIPNAMAGNVVLLKHAPNVLGCAQAIQELFTKAGFPNGIFQSLIIDIQQVEKVIAHPIVQGVTFTGSERAGAIVASLASKYIKKTVLELGGSDPFIVLEDADLEKSAKVAIQSRMLNAGQTCISAKRFLIHQKNYSKFMEILGDNFASIKQGNPTQNHINIGPLARLDLAKTLKNQLDMSLKGGAKLIYGGTHNNCNFLPSLVEITRTDVPIFTQETFGPLMAIKAIKNDQEAIQIANQTTYGLGASIWTQDLKRGYQLAQHIDAGSVFVNSLVKSDPRLPFGGIKQSGFGRELGEYGLKEFLNIKTIVVEK